VWIWSGLSRSGEHRENFANPGESVEDLGDEMSADAFPVRAEMDDHVCVIITALLPLLRHAV